MGEEGIKELETEIVRLRGLVYYDGLTGLLNRRGFMEEAERQFQLVSFGMSNIERRTGFQIPYSILFLDIDNFKKINDQHGHDVGDAALKALAGVLKERLREGDLPGRLGGEEFVVALIGVNLGRGKIVGEKLRKAVEDYEFNYHGQRIPLTISIGVAEYRDEKSLEELIASADKAMYTAKQQGKNRVISLQE